MFFIARAPGWQRVRLMAAIALTAGLYNAVDLWFYLDVNNLPLRGALVQINVVVAALHAAMWMRFTFSDATGSVRSMPSWSVLLASGTVLLAAGAAASNAMLDRTRIVRVAVPWLGLDERVYPFNDLGNAVAAGILLVLGVSLVQHIRRVRRGDRSALGIVVGLTLYAACIMEEALVASGVLEFMYLASPGYLFAVLPLTVQLLQRFADDAHRLANLSASLSTEVEVRTVERDEARESLLEQQRLAALGRLAAGVGHEINNPLQYLVFQLEAIRASLGPSASRETHESLQEALDGARRIGGVVTSLRTYGVRSDQFRAINMREAVEAALRIASPQLRHRVQLTSDLQSVPFVLGDEGQLVQIILNPLVNAAQALQHVPDATTPHILVRLHTTPLGDAELIITDNGLGFDPSVLPQLGEPYVTTRAHEGGSGLGLFVTRGLVATHGGTLTFDNAPEGGARVRICIPVAPEGATEARSVHPRTTPAVRSARVLVVDDEAPLLIVMKRLLERLGHQVTAVPDGETALQRLATEHYDVVISDLTMPRISGAMLAAALAEHHTHLRRRLIILTGGATTEADETFLARDDVTVLTKPVSLAELELTITAVLSWP